MQSALGGLRNQMENSMATFTTLDHATMYDVTDSRGTFLARSKSGAEIMSTHANSPVWPAGACAWLTQCPSETDDTEPVETAD
jgi:hypothetical protein